MITEKQYYEALKIVNEYHKQIEDKINEIESKICHGYNLDTRLAIKAKCVNTKGSQGNDFSKYLTENKEYDILKIKNNNRLFNIVTDNGSKRTYRYDQSIWIFVYE